MVSNKCCVPGCSKNAASKFGVPKNMMNVWENIIGCPLNRNSRVCANHFKPSDITSTWESGNGSSQISICLRKPRLKSGVIPINNLSDEVNDINQVNETMTMLNEHNYSKVNLNDEFEPPLAKRACIELSDSVIESISEVVIQDNILINDESSISLPMNWFCDVTTNNGSVIAKTYFILSPFQIYNKRVVEKRLVILKDSEPTFYINEKQIKLSQVGINNYDETLNIEYMLNILVKVNVCRGVKTDKNVKTSFGSQFIEFNGHWKHANCLNIIEDGASQLCVWCNRLKYTINKKFKILSAGKSLRVPLTPSKKSKFKKILKSKKIASQKFSRAHKTIKNLKLQLNNIKTKISQVSSTTLNEIIQKSNLSDCQSNLVNEIFNAAKVKCKNQRRYSDNWILLCLILQIRSPSGYRFLRNQNILPLPCVKTVRKYLLAINNECGFDLNFFKLLKKKMLSKSDYQKKGILLLDEVYLRSSISVNSRTLSYSGLEDFGGELPSRDTEKADHGLVFMWSSLADSFTQPIAVFASKGPVKGMDLTKLVVKAIMLLENAGAQVLGLTTDGASTNRTMWNNLGISGKIGNTNNSFCNPFDETRKVFVFSDAPHLIKTIRNRLYEKKCLKLDPSKPLVKWEHFSEVYRLDENKLGKVCPKITRNHIYLTNLSKMKVKFATQLFSNSMAVGIQFYRNRNEKNLIHSEETEQFTLFINNLFDAFNRKFPAEGIRKNSYDFEILENAMKWLDSWESKVIDGLISSNEFLTQQTADGLRVTIKSSIELSKYLLDSCNFSFVLTAKMNQDKLEKFFGIIRQVSGPNDHPSTPTFLQLYRMLTVSSLIKPPKSGNCTVDEVQKPVLDICDFKNLISNESLREEKIKNMKSKLDLIIEDKNWDCEDIFLEHDYTKSSVFECVVYYLGGYLARRLCKKSKCEVCIKNLKNDGNLGMESELVNLKSKGFLTHPSGNLYKILKVLETCFCKHASAGDVFENTYNEFFLHVTSLTFSCSIHKYEMITDIFTIYITMRMRQFTYIENQKLNKINRAKKKLSKLVSS